MASLAASTALVVTMAFPLRSHAGIVSTQSTANTNANYYGQSYFPNPVHLAIRMPPESPGLDIAEGGFGENALNASTSYHQYIDDPFADPPTDLYVFDGNSIQTSAKQGSSVQFTSSIIFFNDVVGPQTNSWTNSMLDQTDSGGGYLGLKLVQNSFTYYGWVGVGFDSNYKVTFNRAAMNSTAGASILAGQTVQSSVPEIDPATGGSALSLVAGVLAMIEQRRRRVALVA